LGHTLPVYSTITDWLRKLERSDNITRRTSSSGRLPDDHIDALITPPLEQFSFHSVRRLCSTIKHPYTKVWRHLHSAGQLVRNLRLAPHRLSPSQKAERDGMAIESQQMLQSAKHRVCQYFLTRDESRFYYSINHDHMWISDGEEVLNRARRTTVSPK
jgi:hypothetical protein